MSTENRARGTTTAERSELARSLKPQWVWAIALGSAVGWGAFILPTGWMGTAGPLGTVLGLSIGGALMCVIAVSYGLLIRTYPASGGEYAYTYTCLAAFRLFRWSNNPEEPGAPEDVRSTGKPLLSLMGALTGVVFFCLLMVSGSPTRLSTPSLVALGVWVLFGLIFFFSRCGELSRTSDDEMRYLILGDDADEVAL